MGSQGAAMRILSVCTERATTIFDRNTRTRTVLVLSTADPSGAS